MSSHHIIREDQEPALIVDDMGAIPRAYLHQLLEWSPMVMTGDDALKPLQDAGIKIDVWFTRYAVEPAQDHVTVKPMGDTLIETALTELISRGQTAATILSNDTSVRPLLLAYADRLNIVLLGNGQRIFAVKPGFSKWKPQGEPIWLYGEASSFVTSGLSHQGGNSYLTQNDGFYSVTFSGSYGLIGEQL